MRFYLLLSIVLNAVLATAQPDLFQNLASGTAGITGGQTARLNVVYPSIPGIALQQVCSVTLTISDDQGNTLKSVSVAQLIAGHSVSVDLNADTDLVGKTRTQIDGSIAAPLGCQLITSLEIIDNLTQKTTVVVGARSVYSVNPTHAGR
jgi:hypothetical protein